MLEISVKRRFRFKLRQLSLALLLTLVVSSAKAQSDQSSYSVLGVGSLNWSGYAYNNAMGGLGVGYNTRYFFNDLNPATLGVNREAIFQLGTTVDVRTISNGTDSYRTVTGGFKEFGLSLPIIYGKWNVGLSINPYSSVSYGFTQNLTGPGGGTTAVDVTGSGGIDQTNLSTSFKIGGLSLGLKGTYYFGTISSEEKFTLEGIGSNFATTAVNERRSYGKFAFSGGLYYELDLGENDQINFGAYYNPAFDLSQTTLITFENETLSGNVTSADTILYDKDQNLGIRIPERIGFGISYEKFRNLGIGLDVQFQNWSQYRNKENLAEAYYGNSYRIAVGAEYIPNIEQPTRLLNVTSFRFGVHYEKTPFLINNETVNDFGINFGVSIPLNSFWGLSHVTTGVTLGQRGNISTTGLVRENYVKLNLGFTLQDITWFSKQRFN